MSAEQWIELIRAKTILEVICRVMRNEDMSDAKVLETIYEICDYGHLFDKED